MIGGERFFFHISRDMPMGSADLFLVSVCFGGGIPTTQKAASSTSRDLTNLAWSKWQNAATFCVDVCL